WNCSSSFADKRRSSSSCALRRTISTSGRSSASRPSSLLLLPSPLIAHPSAPVSDRIDEHLALGLWERPARGVAHQQYDDAGLLHRLFWRNNGQSGLFARLRRQRLCIRIGREDPVTMAPAERSCDCEGRAFTKIV